MKCQQESPEKGSPRLRLYLPPGPGSARGSARGRRNPGAGPALTQTIPVGLGPVGVTVSPQTGKIYLTDFIAETVSVIG
jgi:streptogramin lyase